eukprot:g3035.t1
MEFAATSAALPNLSFSDSQREKVANSSSSVDDIVKDGEGSIKPDSYYTPNDSFRKKSGERQNKAVRSTSSKENQRKDEAYGELDITTPSSPSSSVESELLPDKHYSHLRCIQKLSHVHSTIWEVLTTPSPTRAASKRGDYKEFMEEKNSNSSSTFLTELDEAKTTVENSSNRTKSSLNPKPPAGSPPRSGRTPYKWHPGDEMIAALTTEAVSSPSLFRDTHSSSSENGDDNKRSRPRGTHNSGRSKQKRRQLRSKSKTKEKCLPADESSSSTTAKYHNENNDSTPTSRGNLSSTTSRRSSRRSAGKKKISSPSNIQHSNVTTTTSMSQAPSPSTSPHQQEANERPLNFEKSNEGKFSTQNHKDENKSPNVGVKELVLVTSPSSTQYDNVEVGAGEEKGSTGSFGQNIVKKKNNRNFLTMKSTKQHQKDRAPSKGPIKLIRSQRTPRKKIGPDTRSSRLPPPKSPYSHLRCVQNLHIINSPTKEASNIDDVNNNNDNKRRDMSTSEDDLDNPDQIEVKLVAGKIKPVPCIALQYRDKYLPQGQLRCLEVQLPIIPKPDDLPLKMYIQEYCEYVCHRLCKEAKPFQYIELNQLRRVVTCVSLKVNK